MRTSTDTADFDDCKVVQLMGAAIVKVWAGMMTNDFAWKET
jgi:hypothetical protein